MPAAVETMVWTAEKPWHGLGTEVAGDLTADEMLEAAGLNWTVSKRRLHYTSAGGDEVEIPDRFALVRDTDQSYLSAVGTGYHPLQNRDAFAFFTAFVAKGGATMETAGSLDGGRIIWGLAKLPSGGFRVGKTGDVVEGYLLLVSPHVGGMSIRAKVTSVRVVCRNTLELALSGSTASAFQAKFHHGRDFSPAEAVEAVGIASEEVAKFARTAATLKKLRMTDREVLEVLSPIYQPDDPALLEVGEAAAHPALRSVLESYRLAPGADPGTGWGVLNAVTYHADHLAGRAGADRRLASAWLGTEAGRKQATLAALLERV